MKKALGLAALMLFAVSTAASAQVDGTAHDLVGVVTGETELCAPCHVPHNARQADLLWSRDVNTGYTMYSSGTLDGAMDADVTGNSLLCLSCHDGTLALGDYTASPTPAFPAITGSANIGSDLSTTHPVGVVFDEVADTGLQVPTTAKLFDTKVQCGSCHNPHNDTNGMFLLMSNANSDLCTDCHLK